jgi:hypothetical protein
MQYRLRAAYARPLTQDEVGRITQAMADGLYPGASGDSLRVFDGRDLTATPSVSITVRNAPAVSTSGGARILTLPTSMPTFVSLGVATQLEQGKPRRFPIDVGDVIGPIETLAELRITLPEGWRAHLPAGLSETSSFGSYTAEYAQVGRELRITRHMTGRKGIEPPNRVDALIAWLRAISRDDAKFIILEPGK